MGTPNHHHLETYPAPPLQSRVREDADPWSTHPAESHQSRVREDAYGPTGTESHSQQVPTDHQQVPEVVIEEVVQQVPTGQQEVTHAESNSTTSHHLKRSKNAKRKTSKQVNPAAPAPGPPPAATASTTTPTTLRPSAKSVARPSGRVGRQTHTNRPAPANHATNNIPPAPPGTEYRVPGTQHRRLLPFPSLPLRPCLRHLRSTRPPASSWGPARAARILACSRR